MTDMQRRERMTGRTLVVAMVGLTCLMIGEELSELSSFTEALTPQFIGSSLAHVGVVIGSFVGGRSLERARKVRRS